MKDFPTPALWLFFLFNSFQFSRLFYSQHGDYLSIVCRVAAGISLPFFGYTLYKRYKEGKADKHA